MRLTKEHRAHIEETLKNHDTLRNINWDFNMENAEDIRYLLGEIDFLKGCLRDISNLCGHTSAKYYKLCACSTDMANIAKEALE